MRYKRNLHQPRLRIKCQTDVSILWQRVYRLGLRKCDVNSISRHISGPLLFIFSGLVSGAKAFFGQVGQKILNISFILLFCSKITKHLHQPEMFNWSSVLHIPSSLNLHRSQGAKPPAAGGKKVWEPPVLGDFWDLL